MKRVKNIVFLYLKWVFFQEDDFGVAVMGYGKHLVLYYHYEPELGMYQAQKFER
jgi:hypothetical protein